jgi:phytoene synthase
MIEDLPGAQRLALTYAPASARQSTLAVMALDARLSAGLRARSEPIAKQLRLAWWRETLTETSPSSANADPVLKMLQSWRDPGCLSVLPDAWEVLLSEDLTERAVRDFATGRARAFVCLAQELGAGHAGEVEAAAKVWALADLAAHVSSGDERDLVVALGGTLPSADPLPRMMRPLAVLAGLGHRALQRGGEPLLSGPASMLLALRVGLTGR